MSVFIRNEWKFVVCVVACGHSSVGAGVPK